MRQPTAIAALALLAALAALCLGLAFYSSAFQIPGSYVEGWIADHAARVLRGDPLYDSTNPLNLHNYPPLYALLLASTGAPESDLILLGRKIAAVSTAATALALFALCRALGTGRFGSLCSALLFLALASGAFPGYVAANDPTMLGHAIMTCALALFAARWRERPALLAVVLLVCLAGFVKHHLLAAPLAMTLFLLLRDRKQLLLWGSVSLLVLMGALGLTFWAYGPDFLDSLLGPRRVSLDRINKLALRRLEPLTPLVMVWLAAAWRDPGRDSTLLVSLYIAVALVTGLFFTAGDGVHHNVFYDATLGLAAGFGLTLERVLEAAKASSPTTGTRLASWALTPLVCAPLLLATPARLDELTTLSLRLRAAERETQLDLAHLRLAQRAATSADSQAAALICERPALCYWGGFPVRVDLFSARQAFLAGQADEAQLIAAVERREFAGIQLNMIHTEPRSDRMSPELLAAILRNYRTLRESDNGFILQPSLGLR